MCGTADEETRDTEEAKNRHLLSKILHGKGGTRTLGKGEIQIE